jgi:hypothetical protein
MPTTTTTTTTTKLLYEHVPELRMLSIYSPGRAEHGNGCHILSTWLLLEILVTAIVSNN